MIPSHLCSRRETPKSEISMFRYVSELTSVNFIIDESVRTSYIKNQGCPSRMTEPSFPPVTADSSLQRKEVLSEKYNFEQQLEKRASMVDKKFGDFHWDFSPQTVSTSRAPDGCFIDSLGCSSSGKVNRRNMVILRKEMIHPLVGTTSSKDSPPDISQESKLYFSSHTNGQHSGLDIFQKKLGEPRLRK